MLKKCPSAMQLACFVSGGLPQKEAEAVLCHLKGCRACEETVMAAEELGRASLPSPTREELAKARRKLMSQLFASSKASLNAEGAAEGAFKRLSGFVSGAGVAAAGMLFTGGGLPAAPSFAGNAADENFLPDAERNAHEEPSILNESPNFEDNGGMPMSSSSEFQDAQHGFGAPEQRDLTSPYVYQFYPDTCAIRSQELILHDFGIDLSQEQLIGQAEAHGWYSGNGTSIDDVGKLLEYNGVSITRYENGNIYNLANELAQGHRVIVGVDAGELWHDGVLQNAKDALIGDTPNHALIVAGVDTSDPNEVKVILTDPGTGDVAKSYPLDEFMDAWKDSGCLMISTSDPAPIDALGMKNFDYASGHIASVCDIPYQTWADGIASSMALPSYVSSAEAEAMAAFAASSELQASGDDGASLDGDPSLAAADSLLGLSLDTAALGDIPGDGSDGLDVDGLSQQAGLDADLDGHSS